MQLTPGPEDGQAPTEDWEDVTDTDEVTTSSTNGSIAPSAGTVRRRQRRVQTKTTFVATPNPSKNLPSKGRRKTPLVKTEDLQEALTDGARFTAVYAFDIFKHAIDKMRRPLSWILVLYMLAWLASRVTPTIRTALSPLCFIPGISSSALCVPVKPPPPVNFEELVQLQGSTFEKVIGETAGNSQLSIGVLSAEMATRDLSSVVRFSDLKSRDSIADSLDTISADAKRAGRGLSKLESRVLGAIDEVMALNNYAMVTIGSALKKAPSPLLQAVSPFNLGPTAEEIIAQAFVVAMDQSERVIAKLILETEISWQNLEQLDTDITVLYEIVMHEDKHTTVERDELLAQLWTRWGGGNKKALRDYNNNLELLKNLEEYRKQAAVRVKATLRELNTMSDDLEVLRDRVAAPGLLDGDVPLQVHIDSIQNGLERLREERMASRGQRIAYDETVRLLINGGSG